MANAALISSPLQMSKNFPVLIPMGLPRNLTSFQEEIRPLIVNNTLQLSEWKLIGDITLQKVNKSKFKNFSCIHRKPGIKTEIEQLVFGMVNLSLFSPLWSLCQTFQLGCFRAIKFEHLIPQINLSSVLLLLVRFLL